MRRLHSRPLASSPLAPRRPKVSNGKSNSTNCCCCCCRCCSTLLDAYKYLYRPPMWLSGARDKAVGCRHPWHSDNVRWRAVRVDCTSCEQCRHGLHHLAGAIETANASLEVLWFGHTGRDQVVEGNKHRRCGRCPCQVSMVGTNICNLTCQLGAILGTGVGFQASLQQVSVFVRLSTLDVGSVKITKILQNRRREHSFVECP